MRLTKSERWKKMITLNALYSETRLFDKITFGSGINIIKGKYSGGGDVNGIGKSSVVRLIDYAFLSRNSKLLFNRDKYDFVEGHSVSLEFSIDEEIYKIKRFFRDKSRKVYYGKADGILAEYSEPELKNILGSKFFLKDSYRGTVEDGWFRNLMRFYIKDDINHHQRLKPENFINPGGNIKNAVLVYHNLFLMDLPNQNVFAFDKLDETVKDKKKIKREFEERLKNETNKTVEQYNSEKFEIENRIELLEKSTTDYKFLKNYKEIEDQLVELSAAISEKLSLLGRLKKEFRNYEKSYKLEFDADIDKVKRIYLELDYQVGQFVKKTLENVIQFRKEISENRRKFLQERQRELTNRVDHISEEISALEMRRSKLYKFLEEKRALDSLKHSYEKLIEEKAALARNDAFLKEINELTLSISETSEKISNTITSIIKDIQGNQEKIREIRALFFGILKNAVMVDENTEGALFEIKVSENRRSPCKIRVDVPKSEALGKSRFKILVYDLTVFLNQVNHHKKLPHFLIHDGVFHSIGTTTVVNTLNYMYSQTLLFPSFQYIITANEDELDIENKFGKYRFELEKFVIAEFEDIPKKMFFKKYIP
jgi:uncharacterized protein YydD (DUF2326 family)